MSKGKLSAEKVNKAFEGELEQFLLKEVTQELAIPGALETRAPARAFSKRLERSMLVTGRVLTDVMMILAAIGWAYYLRFSFGPVIQHWPPHNVQPFGVTVLPLILGVPFLIGFLKVCGQYDVTRESKTLDNLPKVMGAVNLFIIFLLIVSFLLQSGDVARGFILIFWGLCIFLLILGRGVLKVAQRMLGVPGVVVRNTLILGAGEVGKAVAQKLVHHRGFGLKPIGFIDNEPLFTEFSEPGIANLKVLGGTADLARVLNDFDVEKVIVAFTGDSHEEMLDIAAECGRAGVECSIIPRLFEIITNENMVNEIGGIPLINLRSIEIKGFDRVLKGIEDQVLGLIALLLSLPVLLITAIAIKLDSRGPVFFKQRRLGKDGKSFNVYKFRSMINGADQMMDEVRQLNEAEGPLFKIKDDPRITRVGRWIRRLSIDELPQILNVIRGEMSLVGPRPPLPEEVDEYRQWQKQRLRAKPGITGLWQVSGRSNIPYDEMLKFDLYYIENWSLWLDIKIILRTVTAVLGGHGAY